MSVCVCVCVCVCVRKRREREREEGREKFFACLDVLKCEKGDK